MIHPPLTEWLENIPYGPPTSKRCQLLSDKGEVLSFGFGFAAHPALSALARLPLAVEWHPTRFSSAGVLRAQAWAGLQP